MDEQQPYIQRLQNILNHLKGIIWATMYIIYIKRLKHAQQSHLLAPNYNPDQKSDICEKSLA